MRPLPKSVWTGGRDLSEKMKKQGLDLLETGGEKFYEGYGEVVSGDSVSDRDIDDVLQKLEAATIGAVESDEELISEVASLATDVEEEGTLDEVDDSTSRRARTRSRPTPCASTCARWAPSRS